ncbi:MAG: hypothetical protein HY831_04455 [Candidatus Aenigmarchaeota archaeon]|nr:hypothetical protein [Candidatus Aenigmarchaeota archaeon]
MTDFKKIDEYVKKNDILPRDCEYHTWRTALNKAANPVGKMRILVPKSDKIARVEYICPECKKYGYLESPWKRPFSYNCEHCKFLIRVPKMKEQFKKEMKKANAAKK